MPWYRRRFTSGLFLAIVCSSVLACGDGPTSPSVSSSPQITGCNSVTYQGITYSNLGCAVGIASFTSTITQSGRTVTFNVTCSAGCVSTVRVA